MRVRRREGPGGLRPRDRAAPQQGADSAALRAGGRHVARAVDAAEVARRLLSGAVELGGVRIASEAVSGGGRERLVSAIETTPVRAAPRTGARRRRSARYRRVGI